VYKRQALAAYELGDVLWQLARAAKELNMTLEDVAVMNIQKLTDRKERNVIKGNGDIR
jgi:NTP pyrophosphatase (non-canonical NTP hydrolase)